MSNEKPDLEEEAEMKEGSGKEIDAANLKNIEATTFFSAKMQDSKVMKGIIDAISAIIDETYFKANIDGLNLTAMDESHICLMHMTLPKELFDGFECDGEAKLGINLEDLVKIMNRAGKDDSIEFKHPTDSEKIQVLMKGAGTRAFSLRLVDIDEEKIPPTTELDVDFDAKITVDSNILEQAIKDAEIYQDTLEVKVTQEGLHFSAEGEVGDVSNDIDRDHLDDLNVKQDSRGVFSLAFLKNIMKMSALSQKVTLNVANNAPLRFDFEFSGSDNSYAKGKVTYFLAPRVEEGDEDSYESD
jgi:proliferating cell nuclear antigen